MVGMQGYPVPARFTRAEATVSNSRFIASVEPAFTLDQAREFLQRIKAEFPGATHHVPAFLIGYGSSVVAYCHDDGEPAGTAGRPALAALEGSGLGDAAVVVTRFFGGTKLGRGGLVRAYGDAVRSVLALVPRAERVATCMLQFRVPYALFERVRQEIQVRDGRVLGEEFGVEVSLRVELRAADVPPFEDALRELSNGALQAEVVETREGSVLPLRQSRR